MRRTSLSYPCLAAPWAKILVQIARISEQKNRLTAIKVLLGFCLHILRRASGKAFGSCGLTAKGIFWYYRYQESVENLPFWRGMFLPNPGVWVAKESMSSQGGWGYTQRQRGDCVPVSKWRGRHALRVRTRESPRLGEEGQMWVFDLIMAWSVRGQRKMWTSKDAQLGSQSSRNQWPCASCMLPSDSVMSLKWNNSMSAL